MCEFWLGVALVQPLVVRKQDLMLAKDYKVLSVTFTI